MLRPKPGMTRRRRPGTEAPPAGGVRELGRLDIVIASSGAEVWPCMAPARDLAAPGRAGSLPVGQDPVKRAAVGEVPLLRLGPGAERTVDGHQLDLREARHVGRVGVLRLARAVVVPGRDALAFRRVQE